jgi:GDPmannose 4,6-dehydratase
MNAIVFGANGQDGYYLIELLKGHGVQAIGVSRSGDFLRTDIASYREVVKLITDCQPNYVFHLAANSTTRHDVMFENHQTISTGTLNILEAVKKFSAHTKVFISGSGLQFLNNSKPIKETDPFEARDVYSVSRIQSVYASRYFKRNFGLQVYVGYFFNHDSPRRSERHMAQKIAASAIRISKGSNERLKIGDISVIKEWTFAGDVVEGIWHLVNQESIFEANLGSGKGYSIEDWLNQCFGIINKDWRDYIDFEDGFNPEYKQLVSDSSLIHSLGWDPKTDLKQLAKMMMKSNGE